VSAIFHRTGEKLTPEELERARARLQAIRADPTDRPRYRDLIARTKLLWQEADPSQRDRLDELLVGFEIAIEDRNPAAIEAAYRALFDHCRTIDHGDRW
jgi:hypothetical protein